MSEIHEFGGFRGGNTGFHSILVENCIKSSQYGGNRRINQRFPKAINDDDYATLRSQSQDWATARVRQLSTVEV